MRRFIALIVNPHHEYFGQIGKVLTEKWRSGDPIQIQFCDSSTLEADGATEKQIPRILVWPEEAPWLAERLPLVAVEHRATLVRLLELNADLTVPERVKQTVREEFTRIFSEFYTYREGEANVLLKRQLKGTKETIRSDISAPS